MMPLPPLQARWPRAQLDSHMSVEPRTDDGRRVGTSVPRAWTCRQGAYPRDRGVHEVFRDVAVRFPDYPAIRTEAAATTYSDLDRRANQLANFLISIGVAAGERVGLLLGRSPELIIAQLAILKAGAVYAPIDPGTPPDRVAFFVRDMGVRVMMCTGDDVSAPLSSKLRVLRLDRESESIGHSPASNPERAARGDDTAYIMYTSGSSGTPKGVEVLHRAIVRLVLNQSYFQGGPGECTLLVGSPGFDGTTYEIWSALLNGGCCAVFPDRRMDLARLERVIRSCGVTSLFFSTGLFNHIVDLRPSALATARHVLVGGEALSASHIVKAQRALPHVTFGNGYGPTECTTFACSWIIGPPETWGCDSVPLGFPINNTECHIVDGELRPVPVGVVGELLLGGDGLARGYSKRPDLTAERFIPHPFSDASDARLYRTGDRCYWLPNGMIAYVGRDDDQVRLRSFRIELNEVEAALRLCPGIASAAAVVREFRSGARGLVGFVVLQSGHTWDEESALAGLALRLPDFMLPGRLFTVDVLPLTPNGKVDREALARRFDDEAAVAEQPSPPPPPPLSALEERLVDVWRRVLRDPSAGADSDFFRCGGDSLLALELILELEGQLGRPLSAGTVHRFSSPRSFARGLLDPAAFDGDVPSAEGVGLLGDGPGTPVFFVPGMQGYGLFPRPLVKGLAGRHPYFDRLTFAAIRAEDAEGPAIEDIAASLVTQVRRVCPSGPYVLVGFSFGGLVAFEMACQLSEAGERVEDLILWDAYPVVLEQRSIAAAVASLIRRGVSPLERGDRTALWRRLVSIRWRVRRLTERLIGTVTGDPVRKALPYRRVFRTALAFRPRAYMGRVHVITSRQEHAGVFDRLVQARDAWSAVVPADQLSMQELPCGHLDLMEAPYLDSLIGKTLDILGVVESVV